MKAVYLFYLVLFAMTLVLLVNTAFGNTEDVPDNSPHILTPPPHATPHINGPNVFGVRPKSSFLYTIPATGDRPIKFSVKKLPKGLFVNAVTGRITGSLVKPGEYKIILCAKNAKGADEKNFRIVVGQTMTLTPPMG